MSRKNKQAKGRGVGLVERQEDQGEYTQEGQQRVSLKKVERVRKKVKGLLGEGGLLYHGEAETISAVSEPAKVSASRRVGKIEAQLQQMLQLRREMLALGRRTMGFWLRIAID
ncbi:hypothetical protein O181_118382 [Austropuccinia psidii MF-1]|uniref:Uncharacterized protein n=1 Tax=Austropuccinia psidii MF-1 TaxID=1389203 RepID=A0A9Q3KD44_9BASI|nr:hypothetical protein [Austropuccinia psidii MF-1]